VHKEVTTMKAKKPASWTKVVTQRIREMQRAAEKGWERGVKMLPPVWRKRANRLTADVERASREWRKRGERTLANVRKATEGLATRAEKGVADVLTPMRRRLDVPTRAEVDRLRKRLEHIERRLHAPGSHSVAA
jgi:hypothetical protein